LFVCLSSTPLAWRWMECSSRWWTRESWVVEKMHKEHDFRFLGVKDKVVGSRPGWEMIKVRLNVIFTRVYISWLAMGIEGSVISILVIRYIYIGGSRLSERSFT
jgi:hypothetical protein